MQPSARSFSIKLKLSLKESVSVEGLLMTQAGVSYPAVRIKDHQVIAHCVMQLGL